jgi:hypothetical protein
MRKLVFAALGAASLVAAAPAEAAFAPITATVVGQPVIDGFGISYDVGGGATLDTSGPLPVVTVPVDNVTPSGSGFLFESSAIAFVFAPGLLNPIFLLNPLLDTLAGTLTAEVIADDFGFNSTLIVANLEADGDLAISADAAALLATLGISGAAGFVVANITFDPNPIPLPPGLALFGAGLLGFAAFRRGPLALAA